MTRKDLQNINSDREIINLRMQAEDLINNIELFTEDDYQNEARRIEKAMDERIAILCKQVYSR